MAALTPDEKSRARYHLGYLGVQPAGSVSFGLPYPIQTLFIVEEAMNNLIAESVPRVRSMLNILEGIECRLVAAQERLAAKQVGEVTLRDEEPELLEREYVRWASRLADTLGVPLYPYSNRFRKYVGGGGSIPVRH